MSKMRMVGTALAMSLAAVTVAAPMHAQESNEQDAAQYCGTEPVDILVYFETGFPLMRELTTEFSRQFPTVSWNIREEQFANLMESTPRLLASDDPPNLIYLPSMHDLVANGLLLNLDPYYEAFGWDAFSDGQLAMNRSTPDGGKGEGSLYAMGINYSLTGIFYNKELAEQIGMTEPPATLAELDAALEKAKAAGIQPIVQNNFPTAGMAFPLQALMAAYSGPEAVNDWVNQRPDASLDTASNLQAAEHLARWVEAGYFPEDANALDYFGQMRRFIDGEGLFQFNGDWASGELDAQMPGNVGFFVAPPLTADGPQAAMSAPLRFGMSANAPHADCAAFFLDWAVTDPVARGITVATAGSNPGGPVGLPLPEVDPGTVTAESLAAGAEVAADDGAMDFLANATGGIFAEALTPELQKLVGGQQTPAGMLTAIQAEYERELGR